jgi:fibronectin-binding autotransporter adhesin
MKPLIRKHSPFATLFVAFAFAGAQSAHAVNAAWNTDAATGNFNTAQWTSGTTTPVAGGTYTVVSGDALFFGTSTTTTLNNDLVGATYAGLTFNSGASAFTIGGNSFTLTGNIVNNSTSTQAINTDIVISGSRTFQATSGQMTFGGNISGTNINNWFLTPTNKITLGGTNTLTFANNNGLITNAGTVDITGSTTLSSTNVNAGYATIGNAVSSTVNIVSGGSLTVNGTTNATKPGTIVGQNGGSSVLNVGASDMSSSGTLTIGANTALSLGNNNASATGTLNINSGTATITAGSAVLQNQLNFIALGRDNATGIVNLNGGTLETGRQFVRDGSGGGTVGSGAATFNFNGGVLKALADQTSGNGWFETATTGNFQVVTTIVKAGGAKIDTNGFNANINTVLAHDSGLGGTADGGLTKSGLGTLTLGAANTYTGATTVQSGNLATDLVGNFGLGNVTVADVAGAGLILGNGNSIADTAILLFGDAGTITLNNATSDTVFGITQTDDSQSIGAGVYTAGDLNTFFGVGSFSGTGTLTVVPEPSTALLGGLGVLSLLRRRRTA